MKRYLALLMMTFAVTQPVWAAPQSAVLAIPGMSCAACPITIKLALNRVTGVIATTFNVDSRQAIVRFDDTKTSIETLLHATSDAGYPASLRELKP